MACKGAPPSLLATPSLNWWKYSVQIDKWHVIIQLNLIGSLLECLGWGMVEAGETYVWVPHGAGYLGWAAKPWACWWMEHHPGKWHSCSFFTRTTLSANGCLSQRLQTSITIQRPLVRMVTWGRQSSRAPSPGTSGLLISTSFWVQVITEDKLNSKTQLTGENTFVKPVCYSEKLEPLKSWDLETTLFSVAKFFFQRFVSFCVFGMMVVFPLHCVTGTGAQRRDRVDKVPTCSLLWNSRWFSLALWGKCFWRLTRHSRPF